MHPEPICSGPLVGDLGTGSFTEPEPLDAPRVTYQDFEKWSVFGVCGSIITGSEGPDVLSVGGGNLTAHLLGGDDTVNPISPAEAHDDFVDGGDGFDTADLGEGTDVCVNVEAGPC